jgi:Rps23 Pro-64 3,4-dihydroxylase Tpa1-like proline 4-hydroxylase
MNLDKYQKCVDFLFKNKCHQILHSKSNFLEHLINTFNLLKKWKQHDDLCFAGMFHNIYGNKYFNPNLNVNREDIKKLIGENAEELVFKFVNTDREKIIEMADKDLIILAAANQYEQQPIFKIEDNLYDAVSSNNIEKYFTNVPWQFDGRNLTDLSRKWNYYLNFKDIVEQNFLEISENILKKNFLSHLFKLKRAYASANTYGFTGEYHVDDDAKEYNEVVTIMYYLNSFWNLDFGGETFFLNQRRDEIVQAITPKPGRMVIFDGAINHSPRPLSKICNEFRMVLTFKYKLNDF